MEFHLFGPINMLKLVGFLGAWVLGTFFSNVITRKGMNLKFSYSYKVMSWKNDVFNKVVLTYVS